MEAQIEVETDGHWQVDNSGVDSVLFSGDVEISFHHPDEVRELIEAAEHLLTLMRGDDDGE